MEWEWSHVRALAKVLGAELPSLRRLQRQKQKPTPEDYDRQLRSFASLGIPIKEVPRK